MNKFKELQDKNEVELQKLLAENREFIRRLRFQKKYEQLDDSSKISKSKKTIAQILTLLQKKN